MNFLFVSQGKPYLKFERKIEKLQYKAGFAITSAIPLVSRERPCDELSFLSLSKRR